MALKVPRWEAKHEKKNARERRRSRKALRHAQILIFDVDIEDLTRNAEPFEAHGFEVHKCMSVDTAMRCVEREELDFALLDQGSPTFEGLRVIRHLVRYNTLYAFRGADAVYRHAVSSGGIRPRSRGLFGETSPDRGHELDYHYFGSSLKK